MDVVYAVAQSMVPLDDGGRVLVTQGTHWPADDPVVRKMPGLFSADPSYGLCYTVRPETRSPAPGIETTTAGPGEKRTGVRRG